jgi:chromosome segregation ATPase
MMQAYFRRSIAVAFCIALTACTSAVAADKNAMASARKNVNDAQTALLAAMRDYDKSYAIVREKFEVKPEWAAANKALEQAKINLDAAKSPIIAKSHSSDAYVAAAKSLDDAVQKLQSLGSDSNATSDDYAKAAKQRTDAEATMKKLDQQALASDSGVTEAQKKLADAQAQIDGLKKQVDAAAAADPPCQEKKKAVDAAQQKLAEAKAALAAAQHPATQPKGK